MNNFEDLPQDLSLYPILRRDLIIDISDEVPVPKHRLMVFFNPEKFVAGYGKTVEAAILDLVDSVKKDLECESNA